MRRFVSGTLSAVGILLNIVVRVVFGRLMSMRPRLSVRAGRLVASTSFKAALFSLGLRLRKVSVDPRLQMIRIEARLLWFISSVRRNPFDAVARVVYEWMDVSPFQNWPIAVYQELDLYTVGVGLHNGEVITLCRFFGLGDWVNEHFMPDWVYWDDQLAAELGRGSQEEESRAYAVAIARAIGVDLARE